VASLLLFSPTVANAVPQPLPFKISPVYLYVSRVAGSLMLGWAVLLFWAQKKPIGRADILLITLFPVVSILAIVAALVARSQFMPLSKLMPMFVLYGVIYATFIPSYIWAKREQRNS
jgi:hypothetical protein